MFQRSRCIQLLLCSKIVSNHQTCIKKFVSIPQIQNAAQILLYVGFGKVMKIPLNTRSRVNEIKDTRVEHGKRFLIGIFR